jgi:hypothetical protein
MKPFIAVGIGFTVLLAAARLYGLTEMPWPFVLTPMWVVAFVLIFVALTFTNDDDDRGED